MQIRKAVLGDIEDILSLYAEQFHALADLLPYFFKEGEQSKEFIKSIIESDESDVLVCIAEGIIKGFALLQVKETPNFSFFIQHKYAYLMDIVTTQGDRGKGYGNALIFEAKKWASEKQLEYIELDVLSNNNNAIRLYNKHGFNEKRYTMFCQL